LNAALSPAERIESASTTPLLRRIFSFPVMVASLLALLAVVTVRERFNDPDMWWHLKTGEVIWNTHTIPTTDLFSFTAHQHLWVPHEWLSEVIIYGAYRWGGYTGLMVWLCFFTAAVLVAGYVLCSVYSGNSKTALLGALTIWLFGTIGFAVRPQMIGYLLLIVELLLLHYGQTRDGRWFFALPPLFAIWMNCHGSFFFGLALAGLFWFSSYFNFQSGLLAATRWDPRRRRTMMMALILSAPALFVNPVGVGMILYPLKTMLSPGMGFSPIEEWQPLQFTDGRSFAFLGILGCIFLLVIIRRTDLLWRELLTLAVGAWLAASHVRMLFVLGILAAPIVSRLIATSWDRYDARRDHPMANALLIAVAVIIAFLAFPNNQNLEAQVERRSPVKALEFVRAHHLSGPMLNEWLYGGYLMWAAPEYPVFIDGRGDVFWPGVGEEFAKWAQLQSDPNALLDKYRIGFCLLGRQSQMVAILRLLPGWKEIYSDDVAVIFVRSGH
jgi:hypothetical protein